MTDVLKHRFISPHTDGADLTQVQPSAWNDGHRFVGGAEGDVLTRTLADASFGAEWRVPSLGGEWVPIPFNAAHYVGDGSGTWTVSAGQVITNVSCREGHRRTLLFYIQNSVVTGSPVVLTLTLPWTSAYAGAQPMASIPGGAAGWEGGTAFLSAGATGMLLVRPGHAPWPAGATTLSGALILTEV